ncbi:MAG: GNAT family N-acetyltransferase [Pirellulales bacterium]|nr:GNAT family N-acetyltransferase [Pirellulales bacterium]
MTITIRLANADDIPLLVDGNQRIAAETEDKNLDGETLSAGLAAMFADPSKGRYYIAEVDGQPCGQIMTTYEWSDWRNGHLWWIQSVYVWAEFRQQGVFRALYEHLARLAQQAEGVIGIRLYVEKDNKRAQEVYHRMGMKSSGYLVLEDMFHGGSGD